MVVLFGFFLYPGITPSPPPIGVRSPLPPKQRDIREERLGERVGCGEAQKTTEKQERTSSNIFTVCFSPFIQPLFCYLASADLQLVVDTGVEVVEDNHLALWSEAGLLLQPHPHEGLDAGGPRDPTHRRHAS